ncbi:MAG: Fic family protein [Planctomycetota bacterium]
MVRQADESLRLLNLAGELIPSIEWFVYALVRKEALLSAQIEGTQATLTDLLQQDSKGEAPNDADLQEVCCYLDVLNCGWQELEKKDGLPISMRLLSETHQRLLSNSRGQGKQPGRIRSSQNWTGGTRPGNASFVPPSPEELPKLLSEFEQYVHAPSDLHPIVRVGLLHAQFETLHPYLDGNGRLGRLLITLLLKYWGLLSRPLLYISLFLKTHRHEYFRRLDRIRSHGQWEEWLAFFLEGIASVADESVTTAKSLHAIVSRHRAKLVKLSEATVLSLRLFEALPKSLVLNTSRALELLDCSRPAAAKAIGILEKAEILCPRDGRKKDRVFVYRDYVDLLSEGTEG